MVPMKVDISAERERIKEAVQRLLEGRPIRSNGNLTVIALAEEADVPRGALTHRHPDLRKDFYAHVQSLGGELPIVVEMRAAAKLLTERLASQGAEIEHLQQQNALWARHNRALTVENERLRRTLDSPKLRLVTDES